MTLDRLRERWPLVIIGVAAVVLIVGMWTHRYTWDDAFINYRVVQQIEAGHGPVFNVGERAEAFTSPLWLGVLLLADLVLPFNIAWIGMIGGMALGVIGFAFAALGGRRLVRSRGDDDARSFLMLPLGAAAVVAFPPLWRFLADGMETGLVFAWLGACAWRLATWARTRRRLGLWGWVLIGLGPLVRPDLAPFTATFALAIAVGDRRYGFRRLALGIAACVAIPVTYQVFRMGYFGVLVANTAIAKSADLARWGTGWAYLVDSLHPYWMIIPVLGLAVLGYVPMLQSALGDGADEVAARIALVAVGFAAGALVAAAYIVRVGGDYLPVRLLLPAILGWFIPVFFVAVPRSWRDLRWMPAAIITLWLIVTALAVRHPADKSYLLPGTEHAVTMSDFVAILGPFADPPTAPGRVTIGPAVYGYRSARGETPVAVFTAVGVPGYAVGTDTYVLDALGITNAFAAHEALRVRGFPGHEKLLSRPWMAALSVRPGQRVREVDFPGPTKLASTSADARLVSQDDPQGRSFQARVDTARSVLGCATLQRFEAATSAPMTWHRFASNVVHSWANQRLTIPAEPADAAKTLCSPAEQARFAAAG